MDTQRLTDHERRITALESRNSDLDGVLAIKKDIQDLVVLLKQVRAAFRLFIVIDKAMRWVIGAACGLLALYYLFVKHNLSLFSIFTGGAER